MENNLELSLEEQLKNSQAQTDALKALLAVKASEQVVAQQKVLGEQKRKAAEAEEEENRQIAEIKARRVAREKAQREAEEELASRAAEELKERQAQLDRENLAREQRVIQENKLREAEEANRRLQQQIKNVEDESQRISTQSLVEAEKPISIAGGNHPLSKVLGFTNSNVSVQTSEIDYAASHNVKPAEPQAVWTPRPKAQQFADQSTSGELERSIKARFKMNANPTRCDQLSARWDWADISKALDLVAERLSGQPIAHDALFSAIEFTLTGTEQDANDAA